MALRRPVKYPDDIEPTCLYPTRAEVSMENARRLKQLQTESLAFSASDKTGVDEKNGGRRFYPDPAKLKEVLDKVRRRCITSGSGCVQLQLTDRSD